MKLALAHKQQSGVMLIEVLISMLLFIIGIMGIISLQANSLKYTNDAKFRVEASNLGNAIIGRMWADPLNLSAYALSANTPCPGNPTTERDRWLCSITTTLPNAMGANSPTIAIGNATSPTAVTVTIKWQKDATDSIHEFVVVTDISMN